MVEQHHGEQMLCSQLVYMVSLVNRGARSLQASESLGELYIRFVLRRQASRLGDQSELKFVLKKQVK
jgi:hypothetical protein